MQRTLDVSGKTRTIHTTNGIDTRTSAVYIKDLKPYDSPLPNGFNKELGDEMWFQIVSVPTLWDQGEWRGLVYLSDAYREQEEEILSILNAPKSKATCGTAMCAAGWIAELAAADWVIDNEGVQAGKDSHSEQVLVPVKEWSSFAKEHGWEGEWSTLDSLGTGELYQRLQARGFTSDTHVMVSTMRYALMRLGLSDDYLGLFSANNDYPRIRACLDVYAVYGDLEPGHVNAPMAHTAVDELEEGYANEAHQYFGGSYHNWAKATLEKETADV